MANPRTVTVLLFDGVNAVDAAGPLEAFATVRPGGRPAYVPRLWSIGPEPVVRAESGLRLCADGPASDEASGDLLLIPGGAGVREPAVLRALADWLRRNHHRFDRLMAVCTGAYALAEAGLADGRVLTTHWAHARELQRRYPAVRVEAEALFRQDGRLFSSGGVTAGIDLALELIEADHGPAAAMAAARELVVFLRRSGGQAQFSGPLRLQSRAAGPLGEVCLWAASNLDADLSVEALAARAGLSPRQFSRRFRAAFGTAPGGYVQALRLDGARALLGQGVAVAQAAAASGFRSPDGFRRAFERRFAVAPGEYRRRFSLQRSPT